MAELYAVLLQSFVAVGAVGKFEGKAGADLVLHAFEVGDFVQIVHGGVVLADGEGVGVLVCHRRQKGQPVLSGKQVFGGLVGLFGGKAAVLLFGRNFDQTFEDSAGKFGVDVDFAAV